MLLLYCMWFSYCACEIFIGFYPVYTSGIFNITSQQFAELSLMYELSVNVIVVSSRSSIGRGRNGYWSVKVCFKLHGIVLCMLYIITSMLV